MDCLVQFFEFNCGDIIRSWLPSECDGYCQRLSRVATLAYREYKWIYWQWDLSRSFLWLSGSWHLSRAQQRLSEITHVEWVINYTGENVILRDCSDELLPPETLLLLKSEFPDLKRSWENTADAIPRRAQISLSVKRKIALEEIVLRKSPKIENLSKKYF